MLGDIYDVTTDDGMVDIDQYSMFSMECAWALSCKSVMDFYPEEDVQTLKNQVLLTFVTGGMD